MPAAVESNASSVLEEVPSEDASILELLSEEAAKGSTGMENVANQQGLSLTEQLEGSEILESVSADEKEIHDFLALTDSTEQNQTAEEGFVRVVDDSDKYFDLSELFKWHYNYEEYDTSNDTIEVDDEASDEVPVIPNLEGKLVKFVDEDNVSANDTDTDAVAQLSLAVITEEPVIERTSTTTESEVDPLVTNNNYTTTEPSFIETTTTTPYVEATMPSTIETPTTEGMEFSTTTSSWFNTTSTVDVEETTTPRTSSVIPTTPEVTLMPRVNLTEYFQEHPYATEITSENYPNPYPDNYNQTWR